MAYRARSAHVLLAGLLLWLTPVTTFAFATADVDANNQADALTDGLLALRHQFGFVGDALVAGAIGANATRSDAGGIGTYLGSQSGAFDVDGNQSTDALTDGLLLLRYLFGFRGEALIAGAVGDGATRFTAEMIEEYLLGLIAANTPPDAKDDEFQTADCRAIDGNVLADNGGGPDVDADGDDLTVETTQVAGPDHGQLELQSNGLFSYTPDPDFVDDAFTYRIGDGKEGTATATVTLSVGPDYPFDCIVRLNHVQAKGTHNSYHVEPVASPQMQPEWFYTHPSISDQLTLWGVRQVEFDIHYAIDGNGAFVRFDVFHLPALDPTSTCPTLVACLGEIKVWSDANPLHMPIVVWLEPKDDIDDIFEADPQDRWRSFSDNFIRYQQLEAEIRSVFNVPARILTPDDVRGQHADLPTALANDGWPALGQLRGRVIFALLDDGAHRALYLQNSNVLANRLMFVDAAQQNPVDDAGMLYAALFKINNAQQDAEHVSALVSAGFIVSSNLDDVVADADTLSQSNQARLDASLAAGIQFGSTDYPRELQGVQYWFDVPPGGDPARCNPVATPPQSVSCTPQDIEALPVEE